MWHGPVWSLGVEPPAQVPGSLFSNVVDLSPLVRGSAPTLPLTPLPSAILVKVDDVESQQSPFWSALADLMKDLPCEVPLVFLAGPHSTFPNEPLPHAVVSDNITPLHLFQIMCDLQRTMLRTEEAEIRQSVFGRVENYGTVPHREGPSSLLIIGLGERFLEIQNLSSDQVDVIGAFNQNIAEDFLTSKGFDAVILDAHLADNLENLRELRMDARFATLPALVFADHPVDRPTLFDLGATDVLSPDITPENLKYRISTAVRTGERRRITDSYLAESHRWLVEANPSGGITRDLYDRYLDRARSFLKQRGLDIHELRLLPQEFTSSPLAFNASDNIWTTVLSIANAASREEDLICVVDGLGPVAVLKNEQGKATLKARINAILSHTIL